MMAPLVTVLVSGSILLALIVLVRHERSRGARYAAGARGQLDRTVADVHHRVAHRVLGSGRRTFRQSVHYIFHQILTAVLHGIRRAEAFVRSIVHFNKTRAKRAEEGRRTDSHLGSVAAHKHDAQLSDTEKQRKREEALNGQ